VAVDLEYQTGLKEFQASGDVADMWTITGTDICEVLLEGTL
jgi:hypothetical protein